MSQTMQNDHDSMVLIKRATSEEEFGQINAIREEVFVIEQQVPKEEEYDEFEDESHHFLATEDGLPLGCGRWRETEKGIKLERIAVLKKYRGNGYGEAIVQTMLNDIEQTYNNKELPKIYLHSQLMAVTLYERTGFKKQGEIFQECKIDHYLMERDV